MYKYKIKYYWERGASSGVEEITETVIKKIGKRRIKQIEKYLLQKNDYEKIDIIKCRKCPDEKLSKCEVCHREYSPRGRGATRFGNVCLHCVEIIENTKTLLVSKEDKSYVSDSEKDIIEIARMKSDPGVYIDYLKTMTERKTQ